MNEKIRDLVWGFLHGEENTLGSYARCILDNMYSRHCFLVNFNISKRFCGLGFEAPGPSISSFYSNLLIKLQNHGHITFLKC